MNHDESIICQPIDVLQKALASKEISSKELTESYIKQCKAVDNKVGAILTPMYEQALASAELADRRIQAGESSPVLGIPIGIKDVICTKGTKTTAASKILEKFVPPYNATVIEKLNSAGAVIIGKLNLDEFAMGSSCENSGYQLTRNPWDLERTPGGSSGGSAAAVAAAECAGSLGTDTGGSIRQPASFCNIVGVKPTYGRVSRYGVVAFASSLDQVGTFARDVRGAASLLNVIAGEDPHDSTSSNLPVPDFTASLGKDIKGMKVGIPKEYFLEGLNSEIKELVNNAVATLVKRGVEIVEISLPHTDYAVATYYLCATAEASSNLARYDGAHYGYRAADVENLNDMYTRSRSEAFGEEVKRRIMLGTFVLSAGYYDAYYLKSLQVRRLIQQDFFNAFKTVDCIITPTSPIPPFKIGELANDPLQMYLADIYTVTASLAGLPGMSVPCGFTSGSILPVGMQIICPPWQEERLFQIGHAYEQDTDWIKKYAKI
jgi:aspartyl-tRNA(Asn)/glutamyl-tRNA(Gln) amidotransferase subunit A